MSSPTLALPRPRRSQRRWAPWIVAVLAIAAVAIVAGTRLADEAYGIRARAGGYVTDVRVPRDGATDLSLAMTLHGGRATVSVGATDLLTATSTRQDIGAQPITRSRGTVTVDLRMLEGPYMSGPESAWTVRVPSDLPVALALEGAMGPFDVDLRDVILSQAKLQIGYADLSLRLPEPRGDVPVKIGGSSPISATVDVPAGTEYRIDGGRVTGVRETPGYAAATDRLTIAIDWTVSVTVR